MSALQHRSRLDAAALWGGRIARRQISNRVILGLLLLCALACEDDVEPMALSFELLAQDANATQATPQEAMAPSYRVFHEAISWDSYAQQALQNKPDATIDFTKELVLAIYLGEKPTGGYGVTVMAVELRGRTVHVTLEETLPPANAMLMQVITNPYAIYRITLPPGSPDSDGIASIEFFVERQGSLEPQALQRLP